MGPMGPLGDQGDTGERRDRGLPGLKRDLGPKGLRGDPGLLGPRGPKGEMGNQGILGMKGDKGDSGLEPFIRVSPVKVTAHIGSQARLECQVEALPMTVTYWEAQRARILENSTKYTISHQHNTNNFVRKMLFSWDKGNLLTYPVRESGMDTWPPGSDYEDHSHSSS
ncbi:hypothetical protein Pcinc_035365 [Petrolisthes cinctipes]|uniref:Uncharacterized protein n=1 Tax=Petrolisthes cinctipes TaxID=88211 RepID=A0AAE1EPG2_PETCI|nr:hypothetical protein Pcinc_035365 [Petrolisthes cinctipes]